MLLRDHTKTTVKGIGNNTLSTRHSGDARHGQFVICPMRFNRRNITVMNNRTDNPHCRIVNIIFVFYRLSRNSFLNDSTICLPQISERIPGQPAKSIIPKAETKCRFKFICGNDSYTVTILKRRRFYDNFGSLHEIPSYSRRIDMRYSFLDRINGLSWKQFRRFRDHQPSQMHFVSAYASKNRILIHNQNWRMTIDPRYGLIYMRCQ